MRTVYTDLVENCVLYIPKGSRELYKRAIGWKDFARIVEE
jgi:hypothetical protein